MTDPRRRRDISRGALRVFQLAQALKPGQQKVFKVGRLSPATVTELETHFSSGVYVCVREGDELTILRHGSD